MYFDLAAFIRYNFKSFFMTRGKNYRLTPKRFLILFIWLLVFIPGEIIYHFFLLLDEVLFPGYHKQEVRQPVFIVGNPRSGTTFLHRLMDEDTEHFTSFKVWEMLLAPSITQRKLIWGWVKFARLIGAPVQKVIQNLNKRMQKRTKAHVIRIDSAEEDEHILIHGWCSESLWPLYPIPEEMLPYFFFDRDLPVKKKDRVMRFYKNMVQRHLFAHGGALTLLSKNPAQTAKLETLLRFFPDARFINLARDPLETVPSMMDYMATGWELLCDPLEKYPHKNEFFDVMGFYYRYPIEFFADKPDKCHFIRYDNLVNDPARTVRDTYEFLGITLSETYVSTLTAETERSRSFQSEHNYSMAVMGLSTEQVETSFRDVMAFYEFGPTLIPLPEDGALAKIKLGRLAKKQRKAEKKERRAVKREGRKARAATRKKNHKQKRFKLE